MNYLEQLVAGWGNYPKGSAKIFRPDKQKELKDIVFSHSANSYIMRGLGRSYGDTAINSNEGIISNLQLNRLINFDNETGILECEAGVSFEDILKYFIPQGYFLPVTPGTKYVTVGGAIANDIHGKNHHVNGTFTEYVLEFDLLTSTGEVLSCSRHQNQEVFWATIGGIGLTGIILKAKFQLIPISSSFIKVHYQKAQNIDKALELFVNSDDDYQYSVAWIDCISRGKSLGRSVLMRGNHISAQEITSKQDPLPVMNKLKLNVPVNLPGIVLNQFSIKAFNSLYYNMYKNSSTKIVDYDSFFYPLDSILNWNRLYGAKGFIQYQAVFPPKTSREGLIQLLEKLSASKRSSFLAVLKSSGAQNSGLLSFPFKGYTLALDIPIHDDSIFSFMKELDSIVLRYGGRVYLAKDSVMDGDTFREMYPNIEKFIKIKSLVDPDNYFSSSMARRLQITR